MDLTGRLFGLPMDDIRERASSAMSKARKNLPLPLTLSKSTLHSAAIVTSAFACYYNALFCGLVFDDVVAIKENKDIRTRSSVINLFLNDFWGTPIRKEESHKSYRPLCTLTFRLNFALHGLDPFGYHLVNVILHCIVSFLLYRCCSLFLPAKASFIAAILFAVHPIHTDAVTSIVGRSEVLSALFYLSALIYYVRKTAKTKEAGVWQTCVVVTLASLGTLCKEQCLTVLPVCAVYEISFYRKNRRKKSWITQTVEEQQTYYLATVARLVVLVTGVIVTLWIRAWIMGFKLPVFSRFDNPAKMSPLPTRPLTYNFLLALNSWLLLFPSSLCCDWTMGTVPLIQGFKDPRNLATLTLYVALGCLAWRTLFPAPQNKKQEKQCLIITMGLSMMVLPFIPASNLFFNVGFVVAERVLYLPSMGFCVIVAYGYVQLVNYQRKNHLQVQMVFLLLCLSLKTIHRNQDWKSDQSLFESGISVNKKNPKLLNNYGKSLEGFGRHEEALLYYKRSMSLQPDDIRSYLYSGRTLSFLGRHKEAEEMFLKAKKLFSNSQEPLPLDLRLTTSHLQVFLNLATVIARNQSRLNEADKVIGEALQLKSDYMDAFISKGQVLQQMNKTNEAKAMYAEALRTEESNADLYNNYGLVLLDTGKNEEALSCFTKALDIDPNHENSILNLVLFVQKSRSPSAKQIAIKRLEEAASRGRQNETLYFRLGMSSLENKDKPAAEKWFRKAIEIQPKFRSALYNLALLLSEQDRNAEALLIVKHLLNYHPDHNKGLLLLGDLYFTFVKNLEKAQRCYEKLLVLDPYNVHARHNLCVVILEKGNLDDAEQCFTKASDYHPDVEYIRHHLDVVRSLVNKRAINNDTVQSKSRKANRRRLLDDDFQLSQTF